MFFCLSGADNTSKDKMCTILNEDWNQNTKEQSDNFDSLILDDFKTADENYKNASKFRASKFDCDFTFHLIICIIETFSQDH